MIERDHFTQATGYRPLAAEDEIVEHDWEYGFDYWDGPCQHEYPCPNPFSVSLHSPEWIGRPANQCAGVLAFRIPIQRSIVI